MRCVAHQGVATLALGLCSGRCGRARGRCRGLRELAPGLTRSLCAGRGRCRTEGVLGGARVAWCLPRPDCDQEAYVLPRIVGRRAEGGVTSLCGGPQSGDHAREDGADRLSTRQHVRFAGVVAGRLARYTGHAHRVAGAQCLARLGFDAWLIALVSRHSSQVILGASVMHSPQHPV